MTLAEDRAGLPFVREHDTRQPLDRAPRFEVTGR